MKYFIENSKGEWLEDPDNVMGPGNLPWTRDPNKAWAFEDEREPIKWLTRSNKPDGSLEEYRWGITNLGPSCSALTWLQEEDLLARVTLTEHEFIEEHARVTIIKHLNNKTSDAIIDGVWQPSYKIALGLTEKVFKESWRKTVLGF